MSTRRATSLRPEQFKHLIRVASVTGRMPERDVMLLWLTQPKRTALPAEFPRTLIHHEPDNTHCPCGCALKRIGEDVSEKLDYTRGVFTVERHVRGKWVCDDLLNTDLEAIEAELKALHPAPAQAEPRQQPKRTPLPPQFPRTVIHHEPDNTQCACGCQLQRIGEDVSEKLDYTPGVFTVEHHVRGK